MRACIRLNSSFMLRMHDNQQLLMMTTFGDAVYSLYSHLVTTHSPRSECVKENRKNRTHYIKYCMVRGLTAQTQTIITLGRSDYYVYVQYFQSCRCSIHVCIYFGDFSLLNKHGRCCVVDVDASRDVW